jgi:hypothetical protein
MSRKRHIVVWVLVVLASVLLLVSVLTTWVNRQMLDNSAWNRATTQVIQDPKVQSALATYTINTLYSNVDVGQALSDRLPKNLKPIGPPLAGALEQPATQGVERLLQRPRVQQLFVNASSVAHQKLVNVLDDKTGHGISTGNGVVTLDVHQMIVEVGTELGLPQNALAQLPGTAGDITLMKSDQLSAAQTGVRTLKVLSVWLLVVVLVLYGLALYLARGARRATLRDEGIAFALVGLLVLIVRRLLGNYVVSSLAHPGYQPATHRLWLIGTAILGQIGAACVPGGGARRPDGTRGLAAREAGSRAERPAGNRLGSRRVRLPAGDPVGRHARPAHLVGDPAPRRPDRDRRLRPAAPDPAGVPIRIEAPPGLRRRARLRGRRALTAARAARRGRHQRRRVRRAREEDRGHLGNAAPAAKRHPA